MTPRVLIVALMIALAFAAGVAVAATEPPLASAHAAARGWRDTPRASEMRAPGAGRVISDLVTGGASSPGPCPSGARSGAGGDMVVSCARGIP
jgi:hypothetical protein